MEQVISFTPSELWTWCLASTRWQPTSRRSATQTTGAALKYRRVFLDRRVCLERTEHQALKAIRETQARKASMVYRALRANLVPKAKRATRETLATRATLASLVHLAAMPQPRTCA